MGDLDEKLSKPFLFKIQNRHSNSQSSSSEEIQTQIKVVKQHKEDRYMISIHQVAPQQHQSKE